MIARPNLDLLSALAPAAAPQTVAILGSGTQNLRFDAAMLQAAKTVRDGSREGVERTLAPKVEQALEVLLNQLAQQPAEQVRQWAAQPDLLKPAVEALARAHGLNAEETAELVTTAPMATKALIQAFDSNKAATVTVVKIEAPEPTSGPQGREPGKTADPAKTLKLQASAPRTAIEPHSNEARPASAEAPRLEPFNPTKDERKTEIPTALAQASAWAGTMVSTRTDDGSGEDSSLSLSSRPVERSSAPVAPTPVNVKVSSMQTASGTPVQAPVSPLETEAAQTPLVIADKAAPNFAVVSPARQASPETMPLDNSNTLAPRRTVPAEIQPEPKSAGKAPVTEGLAPARPQAKPQAPSASTNAERPQALQGTAPKIDPGFQVTVSSPNGQAPAIQDGSLFVLNGDGSSQGASRVAVQPADTSVPTRVPLTATQVLSTAEVVNVPAASPTPVTTAPVQTSATAPVNAGPVLSTAEAQLSASTTPVAVTATLPLQSEAAQPLGASPKAGNSASKADSGPVFEAKALENSAGFQALQRSSHEDAPQTGLAFGQETLRHLMTQVAKELGIREAAFTQVSDALAQATGKENSHLVIKLKPASLGEVQVDLFVEGGKLNAKLLASTAEVRDAFVRDLPAFKASLEAQGLRIDQVSVAVRAESNFNPQGQGQGQSQPQAWALNRPLTQTAPELASSLSTSAWSGPALNDQLFSALA